MNITLLVVQGRPAGKKLVFPRGEYYFGRGVECHVRPESDWVSRQHCMLRVAEDGVTIQDLGSRNGTLVNGERITQEQPLWSGDLIQVGPLVFELQIDATATPAPRRVPRGEETAALRKAETITAPPDQHSATESTEHHPVLPPEKVAQRE